MSHQDDEEWDDDLQDESDVDEDSLDDDDDEPTDACPFCKRQIHVDAPQCPYCKQYITEEDEPQMRKPWWVIAGAIVCLIVVYLWLNGRSPF